MNMLRGLLVAIGLALSVPAHAQVINAPTTNGSVVITAGGTFQTVLAALGAPPAKRRSLTIQNNNTSDSCWIYIGSGSATEAKSILLAAAGGSYARYSPYIPSDEIQGTCATASDSLYVDVQ